MRRTLKLEESIGDYRVSAEINAPEMYIMISDANVSCSSTEATTASPRADGSWVAREFVTFFSKALAAREMMLKESDVDKAEEKGMALPPTKSFVGSAF